MRLKLISLAGLLLCAVSGCHYEYRDHCESWDDDDDSCGSGHVIYYAGGRSGSGGDGAAACDSGGSDARGGGVNGGDRGFGGASAAGGGSAGSGTDAGSGGQCPDCGSDPNGRECLWGEADLAACSADADIANFAEEQCTAVGLSLESYQPEKACEQGYSSLKYECCNRPAPVCKSRHFEFTSCFSDSELKQLASQTCAADDSTLGDFSAEHACEAGGFCEASFTCCS